MAVKATIRVKSNKQIVPKSKEDLRAQVPKIAKSRLKAAATDLKKRMSKPGKKIKYPVSWDSVAQKFKVIIMLRKARNLPYRRTKKMQMGWKVESIQTGYTLSNKVRGSKFVYGDTGTTMQSYIHQNRWPSIRVQADIVVKNLPAGMIRALTETTKKLISSENAKGTMR